MNSIPPRLQGFIILALGIVLLLAGGMLSALLLSGEATGSKTLHLIAANGVVLTLLGTWGYWRGDQSEAWLPRNSMFAGVSLSLLGLIVLVVYRVLLALA